jgi:hypothetical protein
MRRQFGLAYVLYNSSAPDQQMAAVHVTQLAATSLKLAPSQASLVLP